MKRFGVKFWQLILGILCTLLVILCVGILADHEDKNETPENKIDLIEQARSEVSNLKVVDIPTVIQIYQPYIDIADDETKVTLYENRVRYILQNDLDKKYGEQAIEDQIAIDNIEQTIDSAIWVVNVLYQYSDNDTLLEQYNNIIRQREEAEGINPDMETVG